MLPSIPGPSRTERGLPSPATGSPGRKPEASSYICTVISSSLSLTTSPNSFFSPTSTASLILKGRLLTAFMTGPEIQRMTASLMIVSPRLR